LADANLAASNMFGVSISNADGPGTMTWDQAQSWVAAMGHGQLSGLQRLALADRAEPGRQRA